MFKFRKIADSDGPIFVIVLLYTKCPMAVATTAESKKTPSSDRFPFCKDGSPSGSIIKLAAKRPTEPNNCMYPVSGRMSISRAARLTMMKLNACATIEMKINKSPSVIPLRPPPPPSTVTVTPVVPVKKPMMRKIEIPFLRKSMDIIAVKSGPRPRMMPV